LRVVKVGKPAYINKDFLEEIEMAGIYRQKACNCNVFPMKRQRLPLIYNGYKLH